MADNRIVRWTKRIAKIGSRIKANLARRRHLNRQIKKLQAIIDDPRSTPQEVRGAHQAIHIERDIRKSLFIYRRHYRAERSALVRKIRHRRRVLSVKPSKQGLVWYDGHQVSSWIAPALAEARAAGAVFRVTSGIRTCAEAWYFWNNAGRLGLRHYITVAYPCSSNHCGYIWPKGAVDLSGWYNFLAWLHRQHAQGRWTKLKAYRDVVGPADSVHFSGTGH